MRGVLWLRGIAGLVRHLSLKRMRLRVARPRPQGRKHIRCVYYTGSGLLTNRQRAPRWVLPRRLQVVIPRVDGIDRDRINGPTTLARSTCAKLPKVALFEMI